MDKKIKEMAEYGDIYRREVGMVWYGMVWYGMVWYGMVWYGMVWMALIFLIACTNAR